MDGRGVAVAHAVGSSVDRTPGHAERAFDPALSYRAGADAKSACRRLDPIGAPDRWLVADSIHAGRRGRWRRNVSRLDRRSADDRRTYIPGPADPVHQRRLDFAI